MNRGWHGNKQKHSLASRGIKISDSKKNFKGVPYHKNIAGVKFTLRKSGRYYAEINIPIKLTEEDIMQMIYQAKLEREVDSINDLDIKDLKKFIEYRYDGAYELAYLDGSDLDRLDDDEDWQEVKRKINEQTERNIKIIKESNNE